MRETCETCRYAHINWRKGDDYERWVGDSWKGQKETHQRLETSAQCRRHAPVKATRENDCDGWPWITGDDWCGEYRSESE